MVPAQRREPRARARQAHTKALPISHGVRYDARMRYRILIPWIALAVAVTTGCAKMPSSTPLLLSAQPATIVLATAIIAPEVLVPVVIEAVQAAPDSAVVIAAAATAGAPDQAGAIRAAVVRLVPTQAEAIVAVTRVTRGGPVVTRVEIPSPDRIAALVERATR